MSIGTPRRLTLLLILLLAVLLSGLKCASYHLPRIVEPPDYCNGPTGPYWRPVVCVDETTLTPNEQVTIVSDVEPGDQHQRSNRPATIFWRTQHQFPLQIDFVDKSCVDQVQCNGQGHCQATVRPLEMINGTRQNKRCTYHVLDGSKQKADPDGDIIITPCCWQP